MYSFFASCKYSACTICCFKFISVINLSSIPKILWTIHYNLYLYCVRNNILEQYITTPWNLTQRCFINQGHLTIYLLLDLSWKCVEQQNNNKIYRKINFTPGVFFFVYIFFTFKTIDQCHLYIIIICIKKF